VGTYDRIVYNGPMKKVLFIPDCHHPYAHLPSWNLLLKVATEIKFHTVVILGDFLDMDSVSSHPRRIVREVPSLMEELVAGNDRLDQLDALGFQRKEYVEGNHEDRLSRYICNHKELTNLTSVEDALELKKRGWNFTPYRRELKVGKLWVTHDCDNAGENAHALAQRKLGASVILGHTHRVGFIVRGSIRKTPHVGAMFGWLGDPDAIEYRSGASIRHEWAHGFGVGLQDDDGVIFVEPCPIIGDRVKVFDKIYKL